jgi:hypothetical protein
MSLVGEIRAPGLVDGEEGIDDEARFAPYSTRPASNGLHPRGGLKTWSPDSV